MAPTSTETLLEYLNSELNGLDNNPAAHLNGSVLDECTAYLTPNLDKSQKASIILRISKILGTLQQDPAPLIKLLSRLVEPFSFSDILALDPPPDFVAGLSPEAKSYNALILLLLEKATYEPKDAAVLAGLPGVIQALVQLWLRTRDVGVADRAENVIYGLLKIDQETQNVQVHGVGDDNQLGPGQGLVWRRIFADKGVYGLLFSVCSRTSGDKSISKSERTVAQARVMSIIPKIGKLDWSYVARSHHPDLERSAGLDPDKEGLLDFVALHMVDIGDDVLMHISLIRFFSDLISLVENPFAMNDTSPSLEYLIQRGLHQRSIAIWVNPEAPGHDPLDVRFLYGSSASYLATYTSNYPQNFLSMQSTVKSVCTRLAKTLDLSPSQWAHGESPTHDLHVLVSLPKICLLPQSWLLEQQQILSPALLVPSKVANLDALLALGKLFSSDAPSDGKEKSPREISEVAAERALYLIYVSRNPTFFNDLVTHAETVALPEKAVAAMTGVIAAIIAARWAPLPERNAYDKTHPPSSIDGLPSESELASMLPRGDFALTGSRAVYSGIANILLAPARNALLPWLMRPPQTFSNLVGGRGDTESAAYKVAVAKFDVLQLIYRHLTDPILFDPALETIRRDLSGPLGERMREGVWGSSSEVGARIGTLDL